MKLQDKVALVTGGSSGIGREICLAFAREGARIGVVASTDMRKAQTVVDQIDKIGGEALAIVADVTEAEDLKAAVDSVTAAYGGLDIPKRSSVTLGTLIDAGCDFPSLSIRRWSSSSRATRIVRGGTASSSGNAST